MKGVDTDPRPPFELPPEFRGDPKGEDPGKWWVYRALGSGWTRDLEAPADDDREGEDS